jgi:hypothetical protein
VDRPRGRRLDLHLARPRPHPPDRPLRFAEPGFFDGWSTPVTNAGRRLAPTNVFFPTENIIDIQHFYAIHHWKVNSIDREPGEDDSGCLQRRHAHDLDRAAPRALTR